MGGAAALFERPGRRAGDGRWNGVLDTPGGFRSRPAASRVLHGRPSHDVYRDAYTRGVRERNHLPHQLAANSQVLRSRPALLLPRQGVYRSGRRRAQSGGHCFPRSFSWIGGEFRSAFLARLLLKVVVRLRAGGIPAPASRWQAKDYVPAVGFPPGPLRQRGGDCSRVLALCDHSDHRAVARHRYKCSHNRISELGLSTGRCAMHVDDVRMPTIRGRSGYDR